MAPAVFKTVELLKLHGVVVEKLKTNWQGQTEAFVIEEIGAGGRRSFSGGGQTVNGKFEISPSTKVPAGSFLVRTAQPLGILAFTLLEPENPDSAASIGLMNEFLKVNERFLIHKCYNQIKAPTERVQ